MRAAGDKASAMAIMRQLQVANFSYANDHNGQFVPIAGKDAGGALNQEWWRDGVFRPYLTGDPNDAQKTADQLLTAPTNLLDPVVVRTKARQWDRLSASYGFNSTGLTYPTDNTSPPYAYKPFQVNDPTRTAFIVSATDYTVNYAGRNLWQSAPVEGKTTNSKMAFRHGGKAIVIYYDGSSGLIAPADISRFDAEGGVTHPFWKAKP